MLSLYFALKSVLSISVDEGNTQTHIQFDHLILHLIEEEQVVSSQIDIGSLTLKEFIVGGQHIDVHIA